MITLRRVCVFLGFISTIVTAAPLQSLGLSSFILNDSQEKQANGTLAGYLGAFFKGDKPDVYFYLSKDGSPTSFTALNKGNPTLVPTKGTKGVRDPAIVVGGGADAGKKWYIVGTDLDIGKTTWDAAQRTASLGIFVWESTDLLTWTNERVVTVEDKTAGMVWAPEAIWDPTKSQYLVYWASRFFSASDTKHTGTRSNAKIRYAYTSDFLTFTPPATYIDYNPTDLIDLTILPFKGDMQTFARFLKDETNKKVFSEISTTGLFGTWTRVGGANAVIQSGVEGPAAYWDNDVAGKAHLLLDFYGGDGYAPYESTNVKGGKWTASSKSGFPTGLRHGSVLPVDHGQFDALKKKWG